jgi:hypothetical protein
MSDEITDAEIDESVRLITAMTAMQSMSFDRDLQIRDAGERGLGLVWADESEPWAIVPDPFYTKEFLFRIKAMCNRARHMATACPHLFETRRVGGDPTDAGSNETVTVCKWCGTEKEAT